MVNYQRRKNTEMVSKSDRTSLITKDSTKMIKSMDRVDLLIKMVPIMKVHEKMDYHMVLASLTAKMDRFIGDYGQRTNSMELEGKFGLMDRFMKGSIIKGRKRERVSFHEKMEVHTQDNFQITR